MRKFIALAAFAVVAAGSLAALCASPRAGVPVSIRQAVQLARETLGPTDGWAAFSTGTTGGAAAADRDIFVVTNRNQLKAALSGTLPARIVVIVGTIEANVDDDNEPLACGAYAAGGYTLEAFLAAYDPASWGRTTKPSGPLETARAASAAKQKSRIQLNIPSDTTLVGVGRDARIVGAHMRVNNANNVIIRNLTFEDAYDCFPAWDPTDGSLGNWNSAYDLVSVLNSTHVWIDHCAFSDGAHPDSAQPRYFGRLYQQHDGAADITNAADLVTLSWNRFTNHDKLSLIGSSDSALADRGKLRVTLHHNLFAGLVQRMPRVRFGQVHVYNNYYVVDDAFSYAWGVGVESEIYAENNFFEVTGSTTPDEFVEVFKGKAIEVGETLVNGPAIKDHVDVVAEYNAVNSDISPVVGWAPTLYGQMHPTAAVPALVWNKAGPFTSR